MKRKQRLKFSKAEHPASKKGLQGFVKDKTPGHPGWGLGVAWPLSPRPSVPSSRLIQDPAQPPVVTMEGAERKQDPGQVTPGMGGGGCLGNRSRGRAAERGLRPKQTRRVQPEATDSDQVTHPECPPHPTHNVLKHKTAREGAPGPRSWGHSSPWEETTARGRPFTVHPFVPFGLSTR